MNFVTCNYSSSLDTESYYINTSINLLPNCKSTMWDGSSCSLYDILDHTKADIFICSINNIPKDIIQYFSDNKRPEVIVNVTNSTDENIKNLINYFTDYNIPCPFLFSNKYVKNKQILGKNIIYIPYAADIFIGTNNSIKFNVNACYIVEQEIEDPNDYETYHIISNNTNIKANNIDSIVPIVNMVQIYHNYDNIIFKHFGGFLPQMFFDSVYHGNNVLYDLDDKNKLDEYQSLIKNIFKIDSINFEEIKNIVKNKHTCLNRVKTFLSQLPCQESIKNIDNFIDIYNKKRENK